jgi:pimeloyl-ACP methyl ester carboxylesterase
MDIEKGWAPVNQTKLYYELAGNGHPLVLISGGGSLDRRAWDDQFGKFAEIFKVVRYDIRGIGESARPAGPFSHSRDLRSLLEFLDIKKTYVVGLSFAGAIAVDFALEYPEIVDAMVLAATGTSSDAKAEANLQMIGTLATIANSEGVPRVIEMILDTPTFISGRNSAARKKLEQIYLDNHDVFKTDFPFIRLWQPAMPPAAERLAQIRTRVLIIEGENDNSDYKAMTQKLSGIPDATKAVIAGAAHAINLDKPTEFNQAVLAFLNQPQQP